MSSLRTTFISETHAVAAHCNFKFQMIVDEAQRQHQVSRSGLLLVDYSFSDIDVIVHHWFRREIRQLTDEVDDDVTCFPM